VATFLLETVVIVVEFVAQWVMWHHSVVAMLFLLHMPSHVLNVHSHVSVAELETRLGRMEMDLQRQTLINTQFEGEFQRAQNDLKSAMGQLEELQVCLSREIYFTLNLVVFVWMTASQL